MSAARRDDHAQVRKNNRNAILAGARERGSLGTFGPTACRLFAPILWGVDTGVGTRTLAVLGEQECWQLLASETVGRVATTRSALPAIVPVNYSVHPSGQILLRTDPNSELGRTIANAVVAFEVDRIDPITRTGWSVQVVGPATASSWSALADAFELDDPQPWVAGDRSLFVRVQAGIVSGRRLMLNGSEPSQH
jgi:hypothetical protein